MTLTALLVATRVLANPASNVFQKQLTQRSASPLFIIGATHALLTVASLPLVVGSQAVPPSGEFWTNIWICALLAVASNVLLVFALRTADLSLLGPINAYKSVISLVLAVFLIGEVPTPAGVAGVLLILAGSYFVVDRETGHHPRNAFLQFAGNPGVQLRFAALALSATEAVFLKKALLVSSPLTTFLYWSILGFPIATAATALLLRGRLEEELVLFSRYRATYLWLAVTTALMQLTTVFTFGKLPVGYALALFQLSTLITVFFGYRYFQEGHFRRRLAGSFVMVAGALLIALRA